MVKNLRHSEYEFKDQVDIRSHHDLKKIPYSLIIKLLSLIVSVIGLWLLLKSPEFGSNAANDYVSHVLFGKIETNQFNTLLQGYIDTYRTTGGILLGVGLFTALFPFPQLKNRNKDVK
jgi:hypothetical protein